MSRMSSTARFAAGQALEAALDGDVGECDSIVVDLSDADQKVLAAACNLVGDFCQNPRTEEIAGHIMDITGDEVDGDGDAWSITTDHLGGVVEAVTRARCLFPDFDAWVREEYGWEDPTVSAVAVEVQLAVVPDVPETFDEVRRLASDGASPEVRRSAWDTLTAAERAEYNAAVAAIASHGHG